MALKLAVSNREEDAYIGGLTGLLNGISPLLLKNDIWGYGILKSVFGITYESSFYIGSGWPESRKQSVYSRGRDIEFDFFNDTAFLANSGFDFKCIPDPYKAELKAYFAWRLRNPGLRMYDWYIRAVNLIPFFVDMAAPNAANINCPRTIIDFGHPMQDGQGNGSSPLRPLFHSWLDNNESPMKQSWISLTDDGGQKLVMGSYLGASSMPANDLVFYLILIREQFKPIERRDLILLKDIFAEDECPVTRKKEPYLPLYVITLSWLREAARGFILDKALNKEVSARWSRAVLSRIGLVEECLHEHHDQPELHHITQEFIDHTFLTWGNNKKIAGKNWYADSINMFKWGCAYLQDWPKLTFDKRNLRRVHGEWPGGRGYAAKVEERTIPEEVVEQIFTHINTLDPPLKRLIILERYTGMRSTDLHQIEFNCLSDDPDDDKFMILSFYQSKVGKWNAKPLLKEDAAHALVIQAIKDQQEHLRSTIGESRFLFAAMRGDVAIPLSQNQTRHIIKRWCFDNNICDKKGRRYNFKWHEFRHFYGTEMALAGHDIVLIQMELGHTSPDMTMVYINQRLNLKKKALVEKGGGRFIDIKGQVDERIAELAFRKDAALAVDVPGGLCALPGQVHDWCEHNNACLSCQYYRADADQLPFFKRHYSKIESTISRLKQEVLAYEGGGRKRMAEIGAKRIAHNEKTLETLTTIIHEIETGGSYCGTERKHQRPGCSGGG